MTRKTTSVFHFITIFIKKSVKWGVASLQLPEKYPHLPAHLIGQMIHKSFRNTQEVPPLSSAKRILCMLATYHYSKNHGNITFVVNSILFSVI